MIKFYKDQPFNSATELDGVDLFTGTGSQTVFPLIQKSGLEMGSTVQIDGALIKRAGGGFTVSANNLVLPSAPVLNAKIIAPGQTALNITAYDQDVVTGVTTPRETEIAAYIGDATEINLYSYEESVGSSGIEIKFVSNAVSGAAITWLQLAPALANGNPGTYGSAGAALYLPALKAEDTLASNANSGTNQLVLTDATGFVAGDYIAVNITAGTYETVKIASIASNTLTLASNLNFNHFTGEFVYQQLLKFWIKLTVPLGIAGGQSVSMFNLSLQRKGTIIDR